MARGDKEVVPIAPETGDIVEPAAVIRSGYLAHEIEIRVDGARDQKTKTGEYNNGMR
jgi:hypothetical protein